MNFLLKLKQNWSAKREEKRNANLLITARLLLYVHALNEIVDDNKFSDLVRLDAKIRMFATCKCDSYPSMREENSKNKKFIISVNGVDIPL